MPRLPFAMSGDTAQLLRFLMGYWRPHMRIITLSMTAMLCATVLSICIPLAAKEVATYGGELSIAPSTPVSSSAVATRLASAVTGSDAGKAVAARQVAVSSDVLMQGAPARPVNAAAASNATPVLDVSATTQPPRVTPTPLPSTGMDFGTSITDGVGTLSEHLFLWCLPDWLTGAGSEKERTIGPRKVTLVQGLLCRCLFMASSVVLYHTISLIAHLSAYRAGIATQVSMVQDSLRRILLTRHPERITVVNPVKLAQIIDVSARTSGNTLSAMLTDVLSSVFSSLGMLVALLYISATLTFIIGGLVLIVQYLYFLSGRHEQRKGARVTAEESNVQAFLSNALARNETIFVFECRDFILNRFWRKLGVLQSLVNSLNLSIHGHAAVSSSCTTLIFVVVLGVCNYLHRRGDIALMDVALYFLFLHQFVNRLLQLAKDMSQTRATLGRLQILKRMLEWYAEDGDRASGVIEAGEPHHSVDSYTLFVHDHDWHAGMTRGAPEPQVFFHDEPGEPLSLIDVDFSYPAVPDFFTAPEGGGEAQHASTSCPSDPTAAGVLTVGEVPVGARRGGIRHISLVAPSGKITALYGPSGSGKSTCLRLFSGLVRPQSGTVHTQRNVVLLEQSHAIFIGSVAENILLQDLYLPEMTVNSTPGVRKAAVHFISPALRALVRQAAEKSGAAAFLDDPFVTHIENVDHPQFSGGQLQRICLARVFAVKESCTLLLLDEPTTGLDPVSVRLLLQTITELRDVHHKTILISTHDHRVAEIADSVIDLNPT